MLDTTLLALSDPTRRAILSQLALGEATVNDLTKPFAIEGDQLVNGRMMFQQSNQIFIDDPADLGIGPCLTCSIQNGQ